MGSEEYDIDVLELDEETCWRLLAREAIGRVGYASGSEVTILPVNAAVIQGKVMFRTADDSALATLADGTSVAFETDHTERIAESGWSVLVRGELRDVTDEADRWREAAVRPWAPGPRMRWMAIVPASVTGRRIERRRRLHGQERVTSMPPG